MKAAVDRSARREVRNPVLALPAAKLLQALPDETRGALRAVLLDLKASANAKAAECLRKHKAPMFVYWKAVAVYSGHLARVLVVRQVANDQADQARAA